MQCPPSLFAVKSMNLIQYTPPVLIDYAPSNLYNRVMKGVIRLFNTPPKIETADFPNIELTGYERSALKKLIDSKTEEYDAAKHRHLIDLGFAERVKFKSERTPDGEGGYISTSRSDVEYFVECTPRGHLFYNFKQAVLKEKHWTHRLSIASFIISVLSLAIAALSLYR